MQRISTYWVAVSWFYNDVIHRLHVRQLCCLKCSVCNRRMHFGFSISLVLLVGNRVRVYYFKKMCA